MPFFDSFLIASTGDEGTFEGVAATNAANLNGWGLRPGALEESMQRWRERRAMPAMLVNHDSQKAVGRWIDIDYQANGPMKVRGRIAIESAIGRETYALLKGGTLSAMSIGLTPNYVGATDRDGTLWITKGDLNEISLCATPANRDCQVRRVASINTPRDIEQIFSQAGVSSRQAKAMGAAAWRSIKSNVGGEEAALSEIIERASAKLARFQRS